MHSRAFPVAYDGGFLALVLNEMIGAGADITQFSYRMAEAFQTDPEVLGNTVLSFERTSGTVRHTIAMAHRLAAPAKAPDLERRASARARIIRGVEDVIQSKVADAQDLASLNAELLDRMDLPGLDYDVETRPAEDLIIEICRDMGLGDSTPGSFPWKRRTPEAIAALNAIAAAPSGQRRQAPPDASVPDRVERPQLRIVQAHQADPDKPYSQWTDEELDRAIARDGYD
jgi:hypothetical protein